MTDLETGWVGVAIRCNYVVMNFVHKIFLMCMITTLKGQVLFAKGLSVGCSENCSDQNRLQHISIISSDLAMIKRFWVTHREKQTVSASPECEELEFSLLIPDKLLTSVKTLK